MATADGGIRISFEIPKDVNDKLTAMCPWGTKAEAMRSLIEVLIAAQLSENVYIVQDLIRGNCRLVVKTRDVQNLNTTGKFMCSHCDATFSTQEAASMHSLNCKAT